MSQGAFGSKKIICGYKLFLKYRKQYNRSTIGMQSMLYYKEILYFN